MRYPQYKPAAPKRRLITAFGGLDRTESAPVGTLSDMKNLSSAAHPHLSPRAPRGIFATPRHGRGMAAVTTEIGETLCYADGGDLVLEGVRYPMGLDDSDKHLIPFGQWLLIFPDRKYLDLSDGRRGDLDAEHTTVGPVLYTLCRADGSPYTPLIVSAAAPVEPSHGSYWLDTVDRVPVLRTWSAAEARWREITDTCLRITATGLGASFRAGDAVHITGLTPTDLRGLAGCHRLLACGADHLVIRAAPMRTQRQNAPLTVTRRLPQLDPATLIAAGDRLFGCMHGIGEDGRLHSVLCACRAGDPFNWEPTDPADGDDAWRGEVEASGPFTGAIVYGGEPHFFKERGMHRVSGQTATAFRIHSLPLEGVMAGCGESLRQVGGKLYYQSRADLLCYDGKRTAAVSRPLGKLEPHAAAAGVLGDRYYLSLWQADGHSHLLVYDTLRDCWHREDDTRADRFVTAGGELYFHDSIHRTIYTVSGGNEGKDEPPISWMAQIPLVAAAAESGGRLRRIDVTLTIEHGSHVDMLLQYGGSTRFEQVTVADGPAHLPITVPIYPRLAEPVALQLVGHGRARVLALALVSQ